MPRPKKWRRVACVPKVKVFGPLDGSDSGFVMMDVEEFESIRLMDLEGLDQTECAEKMGVARTTFQRIYKEAKKKLADAVVNGKVLKIEGGNYTLHEGERKSIENCRGCGRHGYGNGHGWK
ncbi:DUF134 domain-containing protein [Crassaminicella profunda]|uniref:DUF134 domain-containing protein n=1 Tax=Crassaminicella profunda TaxID=1286698 RepID=UPI001CA750CD|nr:DUF134 domain-containing protein [Crassaminicella profunda]QZY53797.1 DUF134 domain-containing protein [Crassaminicella profunda]